MQIGLIGLGRMGMNMGRRWLAGSHKVVAFNRTAKKTKELAKEGAVAAATMKELVRKLSRPRIVWLMLPAGAVVDQHVKTLAGLLSKGDLVIDGGNTYYKDDLRHALILKARGISFMDAGVSGGIWGLKLGFCTMTGGDPKIFRHIEPLLKTLAPRDGYLHCGPTGAGHFVKMVHNGIEYGMMQAYAEGFEILQASTYKTDPRAVAHLWNQGSVVRSWLLELAEAAFTKNPNLKGISGYVGDSGEGRWTVQQAVESGVAAPVTAMALFQRFVSRQKDPFSFRVLAALRNEFGGHATF
ncbi:MAG: 6-phosphogluconate dehydrogenase (decarboxylating) [Elusimicrobia bacterium RIFCSPLOWO2_01_FULL_54_10]|nr:MAG: 6-phosphogluconate dehydrogenase (decarboxylating) [Elusimicrobia bacterium RIFCSPLOWO2_01_FULL_54_10]